MPSSARNGRFNNMPNKTSAEIRIFFINRLNLSGKENQNSINCKTLIENPFNFVARILRRS